MNFIIIAHKMILKKIVSSFDLFSALPTLRARGEPEVTNTCGGLFSIIIFSFFTYVFINDIVSIIRLQRISSKEVIESVKQQREISNITFGIGLQSMNLSQMLGFFQVKIYYLGINKTPIPLPVKICTRQDWLTLSDQQYSNLRLSTHICLDYPNSSIFGDITNLDLRAFYFNFSLCDNTTSPVPCYPDLYVDWLFTHMIFSRYFALSLVVLDVGFNPTKQIAIKYGPYQSTLWLMFNREQYLIVQLFIATYQIITDVSFLPTQDQKTQTGYYIQSSNLLTMSSPNNSKLLVEGFIFGTAIHKSIERSYGKFDQALSYVGGLFGIILSVIGFFLMSFNQYKYELRVSQGAFISKGGLSAQSNFHFFRYLKYSLFDWIKFLFRCQPNWEDCKAIQESLEQANEQIDVKHLLQRIAHMQLILKSGNFDHKGDNVMYMVKSNSLEEAKRRRNIIEYCNKFSEGDSGTTIGTLEKIEAIFSMTDSFKSHSFLFDGSGAQMSKNQIKELQENKSSLQTMADYLAKYSQKYDLENLKIDLQQEDLKAEEQLAISFFSMDEQKRVQIIKSIPIGILFRMNKVQKEKGIEKNAERELKKLRKRKKGRKNEVQQVIGLGNEVQYLQ